MATETIKGSGESSVTVHHHGAHITSWKDRTGREMIYTSPKAIFNGEKAIRGGVPICFPQFGKKGELRQHGFARNMPWVLSDTTSNSLRFTLKSTDETLASAWPFKFQVDYTVTLKDNGNHLHISMSVKNADDKPFSFTTALHSYFTCDAESTKIPELDDVSYIDSIDPSTIETKLQKGPVDFTGEVDRVYLNTPNKLSIPSAGLSMNKQKLPEAVVWNPYIERSIAMGDLPDDAWKYFICIEPAMIDQPATVEPGQVWSCSCELSSS